jgi:quercetin dioxygenase-like cupin family protein
MKTRLLWVFLLLFGFTSALAGQDAGAMSYASPGTSKFVNLPVLPACMTVAVQRGDPSKGPAVLLLKFKPGCVVPWHWHTAGESLMVVSGTGKAEMKSGKPMAMKPGDFAYLPGKSIHQFTAVTNVMMFDLPDGTFDIHYVDASGNEIPPDKVLKSAAQAPVAKPAKTQ